MNAEINTLFTSSFYRLIDFKCKCQEKCKSKEEYSKSFNISFIRKGNFIYKVFRNDFDVYTGYAIIDKPDSEHVVEHHHHIPDECTIIDFSNDFYDFLIRNGETKHRNFFANKDLQSLLIKTDYEVEYLHHLLLYQIVNNKPDLLFIDCIVMDILQWFLNRINSKINTQVKIPQSLKKQHLQTIENAKDYIFNNFLENITLYDIANYCNVSQFHFSRIFKQISHSSPYQFLLNTRLINAQRLLAQTELPIKEVCYQSGFQHIEHFNAAFKNKFHCSPSHLKNSKNS